MQFVINKCFLLNPLKKLAQIHLVVFEKNAHYNSEKFEKNNIVSGSLKLTFNLLTV